MINIRLIELINVIDSKSYNNDEVVLLIISKIAINNYVFKLWSNKVFNDSDIDF